MTERRSPPTVNVFGAGISGLTVAHELAERGFQVRVIERDACLDRRGHARLAIGGVARTQYTVAPAAEQFPASNGPPAGRPCPSAQDPAGRAMWETVIELRERKLVPVHIPFENGTYRLAGDTTDVERKLRDIVARLHQTDVDHRISISGYGDVHEDTGAEHEPLVQPLVFRELCMKRAEVARELLAKATRDASPEGPPEIACSVRAMDPGVRPPLRADGTAPEHMAFAVVDVRLTVLPGEHGFRFFPSYYNHVFDTMRRIPLLDADGTETGWTVYDNVVPTPNQGLVHGGLSPLILPRSPPSSAQERHERLHVAVSHLGYAPTDLVQIMLRIARYMSTCSKRRAAEFERISWWEYLEGHDPNTGSKLYQYSERFERDVKTQSRVLASFDSVWGDARTCGNTYVQLLYNWLRTLPKVDGTLNGPTSEAWLEPWRAYLERRLGVQFVFGELAALEMIESHLEVRTRLAAVAGQSREEMAKLAEEIQRADYHVVAADVCAAEAVTAPLRASGLAVGVARDLGGYTTTVRLPPPDDGPGAARPEGHYGVEDWDRLQVMSGIQYFFKHEFKINNGYVYFNQAPWGLTSINSTQFWRRKLTVERDGYVSLLSVDLCDWRTPAKQGDLAGKTAWECTSQEIAREVWAQILREMRPEDAPWGPAYQPPAPAWFHIDEYIAFERAGAGGAMLPSRMVTPYLVPIKGDFDRRPGPRPWDPTPSIVSPARAQAPEDPDALWQAAHGGYPVHWRKLVFAGVYLKTFTRMSTMEAANESGRHAANAILDHWIATRGDAQGVLRAARTPAAPRSDGGETRLEEARHMRSEVFYRSSPLGDYCKIWDMEHWELPELTQAKQYDEWCFDRGLPHPWDILGIERIPALVSKLAPSFGAAGRAASAAAGFPAGQSVDGLLESYVRMAYPWGGAEVVLQVLRGLRKSIEEAVKRAAAPQAAPPK